MFSTSAPAAESDDSALGTHSYVRIAARSLRPNVQTVRADQPLGWLNDSSMVARVSFDSEVGKRLVCSSKQSFHNNGHRLESAPIRSRGFASLCKLSPGEYDYRVDLFKGAGFGAGHGRSMTGRLVVE